MKKNDKPIRVLNVMSDLSADGGIEAIVLGILRSYDRERFHHDVCCITTVEGAAAEEARALGAEVHFCRKSPNMSGFASRFREILASRQYDVVHSHVNSWSGAMMRGAAEAGVPVRVAHIHSAAPKLAGRNIGWNPAAKLAASYVDAVGLSWISRYAGRIIGISEAALDLHWPSWRNEPGRFVTWAGGVDTERFKPRAGERSGRARAPRLIFVGAFSPDKNQRELLDVLAGVRRRFPGAVLNLVGTGARLDDIRRRASLQGLADAVALPGVRTDVPELLANADIFVSAPKREGLPQAVLEAQSAALPVVASDIGAHREAVAPELRSFLYPLGRPAEAAERI